MARGIDASCIGQRAPVSDTIRIMIELPEFPNQKDRLQWAAKRVGATKAAALWRLVGGEESTVRSNFNGTRTFSRDAAINYGEKLGVPWAWLLEGTRSGITEVEATPPIGLEEEAAIFRHDRSTLKTGMVEIDGQEFVSIPRYDAALSAGPGSINDPHALPLGYHLVEAQWLRALTRALADNLAVLKVDGDSMEPTLFDEDWVLVDLSQTSPRREGVYALKVDDTTWVKRLTVSLASKKIQMISDNARYPMQELSEEDVLVRGRVIWVVGRKL